MALNPVSGKQIFLNRPQGLSKVDQTLEHPLKIYHKNTKTSQTSGLRLIRGPYKKLKLKAENEYHIFVNCRPGNTMIRSDRSKKNYGMTIWKTYYGMNTHLLIFTIALMITLM